MWTRQNELHASSGSPYFPTNPDDVAEILLPFCLGNSGENGQRLDVRNL